MVNASSPHYVRYSSGRAVNSSATFECNRINITWHDWKWKAIGLSAFSFFLCGKLLHPPREIPIPGARNFILGQSSECFAFSQLSHIHDKPVVLTSPPSQRRSEHVSGKWSGAGRKSGERESRNGRSGSSQERPERSGQRVKSSAYFRSSLALSYSYVVFSDALNSVSPISWIPLKMLKSIININNKPRML